jgi:hypothetical protein
MEWSRHPIMPGRWTEDPSPEDDTGPIEVHLDSEAVAALSPSGQPPPAAGEIWMKTEPSSSRRRPLDVLADVEHWMYAVTLMGAGIAVVLLDIGLARWVFGWP